MAGLGSATTGRIVRDFGPTTRALDPAAYIQSDSHGPLRAKLFTGFPGAVHVAHAHLGRDVANVQGTPVWAAERGIVLLHQETAARGYVMVLGIHKNAAGHIDTLIEYQHLEPSGMAAVGARVARGQHVALMGATGDVTGPHLHWVIAHAVITSPDYHYWYNWYQYAPGRLQVGGDLAGEPWIVPNL